jgi:hypothetical protein
MRRGVPAVFVAGLTALLVAWVMSTQPFDAPDEASHYLRAYTIVAGQLLGKRVLYNVPLSPAQTAWVNVSTREVRVPGPMSPPNVGCRDGAADTTAAGCEEATEVGNYQPLAYVLPAAALALNRHATAALRTARFFSALPCAVLLGIAVLLLWDGTLISILGLALALTPMVYFVSSVVNPNGLEICGAVALLAGFMRIARDPPAAGPRVWTATAVAALVTMLAWQLGPVIVFIDAAVGAITLGPGRLWTLLRQRPGGLMGLLAAVGAGLAAYLVYAAVSGSDHSHVQFRPIRLSLKAGLNQLSPVLRDSVGTFGSLTVHLPLGIYWIYWGLIGAVVLAALVVGTMYDKLGLAIVVVGALAFPVVFYAFVYQYTGFGLQGRYVLPVLVVIPVYAAEVLRRRIRRGSQPQPRWLGFATRLVFGSVGALQIVAWWIDARAMSGAHGFLPSSGSWAPPLGWWPWLALAVLGCACLAITAAGPLRGPQVDASAAQVLVAGRAESGIGQRD